MIACMIQVLKLDGIAIGPQVVRKMKKDYKLLIEECVELSITAPRLRLKAEELSEMLENLDAGGFRNSS